jgi:hypothetical protein
LVPVTATPDSGWLWDHWELNGVDVGTANPYTVTMNANQTLTAFFTEEVVPPTQYDLTISVDGSGTTDPAIGVHTYDEGTLVPVTATPDSGWLWDHWELNGVDVGTANPYTVTMNANQTLTAVFVEMPPSEDVTPPTITINEPVTRDYLHSETIALDFSAVDTESGVASISAMLNGEIVENGDSVELFTLSLGTHTLAVTAVDNAGNSATETVDFDVIATVGSLQDLVTMFYESGYFNSPKGMYTSFIKKLYVAEVFINTDRIAQAKCKLGAFINHAEAQSGKHVSDYAANILIADAKYVLNNL